MWEEQFYELSIAAGRQQGLITSVQASRVGVTDEWLGRCKETGLLTELDWDVYQIAGSALGPRYAYPYAAWLAISPELFGWERPDAPDQDAVLSHESAANLHGIGSISSPRMVFTAPEDRTAPRATTIHVSRLAVDDVMTHLGVPVTTPQRTILDLVRAWIDRDELQGVITDAVRRDLVDLQALHDNLAALADEHGFPTWGPEFLRFFMPHLAPVSLSLRNLRAFAALAFPDRVTDVQHRVLRVLADTRIISDSAGATDRTAVNEKLSRDVAAEIVGRTEIAHG